MSAFLTKRYIKEYDGFEGIDAATAKTDIQIAVSLGARGGAASHPVGTVIITTDSPSAYFFVVTAVSGSDITLGQMTVT